MYEQNYNGVSANYKVFPITHNANEIICRTINRTCVAQKI